MGRRMRKPLPNHRTHVSLVQINSTHSVRSTYSGLSLSSLSSDSSAITTSTNDFKERYAEVNDKHLPTPQLVSQAERLIEALGNAGRENVIEYEGVTVVAHKVLEAMLAQAESCGGESGKRYTATAICACVHKKRRNGQETLETLQGLAKTWVSHFLFVFRCGSHSRRPNSCPSDVATPTIDDTSGADRRRNNLRDEILKRDGYQCVVSGWIDREHPLYQGSNHPRYYLKACHILCRAAAVSKSNSDNSSYISAMATFDILRNYASLSEQVISNLKDDIDEPLNAFLLAPHIHYGWDIFKWCFKATETPNKYIVKSFDGRSGLFPNDVGRIVEFRDRSGEFEEYSEESNSRKCKAPSIDLPNAKFIAIHAAIAEILHMSGAGRFFDDLIRKFGDNEDSTPVRCWEDFERMVQVVKVRESLERAIYGS